MNSGIMLNLFIIKPSIFGPSQFCVYNTTDFLVNLFCFDKMKTLKNVAGLRHFKIVRLCNR